MAGGQVKKSNAFLSLSHCLFILPFFLSLAVSLTIVMAGPIYGLYTGWVDLHSQVGLTPDKIQEELEGIIRYLIDTRLDQLRLTYFPASSGGLQHFQDVKMLVQWNFIFSLVGLVVIGWSWLEMKKKGIYQYQKGFQFLMIFPLLLLVMIIFSFDQLFYVFHQVLFTNDLWLFSPVTDPIILVLPSELFALYFFVAIVCYEGIILIYKQLIRLK